MAAVQMLAVDRTYINLDMDSALLFSGLAPSAFTFQVDHDSYEYHMNIYEPQLAACTFVIVGFRSLLHSPVARSGQ